MASVSFYLKDINVKNKTRIILSLSDGGDFRIKIPTGISIKPRHWSKRNRTVLSAEPNAASYNGELEYFEKDVKDIYFKAKRTGIRIDRDYILERLKEKKSKPNSERTFWDVWSSFLDAKKTRYAEKSFTKFRGLENHLKSFERSQKIKLKLELIDELLLERLQNYFYEIADLNNQTTSKYIELVKTFLKWTIKFEYSSNIKFTYFTPISQPETVKVILTTDDIRKIKNVDLGNKSYLRNVRELLLLSTLTGLRYSDYSLINKEHIKCENDFRLEKNSEKNYILTKHQEKTNDRIEIPLGDQSKKIIDKLLSGEIHPISNQKMNSYVKELCELAEINESFEVIRYQGKNKQKIKKLKYELITTHTGRRTFCTQLLIEGMPAEMVMLFSGHKDYKSFSKYVNIPRITQNSLLRDIINKWGK